MKSLFLLRHGKSDWDADYDGDRNRPIGARGRRAAAKIAAYVQQNGIRPTRILCSDAVRTRQTLGILMDSLEWSEDAVRYDSRLYLAPVDRLFTVLSEVNDARDVLVVGHEPTLARAAGSLIGGGSVRVPTAALLRIDLDIDEWDEIAAGTGELIHLILPRQL